MVFLTHNPAVMGDFAVPMAPPVAAAARTAEAEAKERAAVVETNTDATEAKYSAIAAGYWDDPFVAHFVSPAARAHIHKPPLINRGTTARVAAIDSAVRHFFARGGRQVVVLGAGFDTACARLHAAGALPADARWAEVDLPEVCAAKRARIAASAPLRAAFPAPPTYTLHSVDLRDVDALARALIMPNKSSSSVSVENAADEVETTETKTEATRTTTGTTEQEEPCANLDPTQPTLFVSEVVLVYLDAGAGDRVVAWAGSAFRCALFVTFEQIEPGDAFGRVMLANIAARGCALRSVAAYPTAAAQCARYRARGFAHVAAHDMNRVWAQLVASDAAAARHVAALEIFDEVEEWQLLQAHYCFVVAVRDPDRLLASDSTDLFAFMLPYTPRPAALLPAWNRHAPQHLPIHPVLGGGRGGGGPRP